MKIMITLTVITAVLTVIHSCSKKDANTSPAPLPKDYEGFWTGRRIKIVDGGNSDSIQLNLSVGGTVDGKINVKPDGQASDTVSGTCTVSDVIQINTYGKHPSANYYRKFSSKLNKDTLKGRVVNTMGIADSFYLVHNK